MLPEVITKDSKWLSVAIESTIIAAIILFTSQGIMNSFLLISLNLSGSLLLLQLISHRFLYFEPVNLHMNKYPTKERDTYVLYAFTILSGFSLFLGIANTCEIAPLNRLNDFLRRYLLGIFGFLLVIVPLYFKLFAVGEIRQAITERLKASGEVESDAPCPFGCGKVARLRNRVEAWNDLRSVVTCEKCTKGQPVDFKLSMHVG